MKLLSRRAFLIGTGVVAAAATLPIALGGTASFLRRVLAEHFGDDVLEIEGVSDFAAAYAAEAGKDNWAKQMAANIYFAWRGDTVHKIGAAKALEEKFLQTILIRSNIIAIRQGRATEFEHTDPNPWKPGCGLYLSHLAEA